MSEEEKDANADTTASEKVAAPSDSQPTGSSAVDEVAAAPTKADETGGSLAAERGAPRSPNSTARRGVAPSLDSLGTRFSAFVDGLQRPIVFFDIEATGTDPVADRIVEISLLRVGPPPMGIEAPRTWRINPRVRIPAEATEIHGIHNEDLDDAPGFGDIASELEQLFNGADLAGFSIGRFDIRILHAEFVRAGRSIDLTGKRVVDTQVIYHQREPRHLAAALRYYQDKDLPDAHGAEADTVASLEVLAGQLARYDDIDTDIETLHGMSSMHNDAY